MLIILLISWWLAETVMWVLSWLLCLSSSKNAPNSSSASFAFTLCSLASSSTLMDSKILSFSHSISPTDSPTVCFSNYSSNFFLILMYPYSYSSDLILSISLNMRCSSRLSSSLLCCRWTAAHVFSTHGVIPLLILARIDSMNLVRSRGVSVVPFIFFGLISERILDWIDFAWRRNSGRSSSEELCGVMRVLQSRCGKNYLNFRRILFLKSDDSPPFWSYKDLSRYCFSVIG